VIDIAVIGAGPIGIACAIAAKRRDLTATIFEKGALVNSFVHYPSDLEFFSTPELLEIGGHPFTTRGYKPVRAEAIEYYRRVCDAEDVDVHLYERVLRVNGSSGRFEVVTNRSRYHAHTVVVATGFFDIPRLLGVPGEDLPKVLHYYRDPFPFARQNVAVVGARNSAAKVALDLFRHGASVTLIARGAGISDRVKYWIKPDLENRIQEGNIRAFFHTTVEQVLDDRILIRTPDGDLELENDWVLAMTGYLPDFDFLRTLGIEIGTDVHQTPVHDPESMETNRKGMYLAGVVCGGLNTSVWFVENSRVHAERIVEHIVG
jgi:thioredoxin reductase (NADPH)